MSAPKGLVHLIGIGGIGMSGVARMYLSRGWKVQGSDAKPNEVLPRLSALGIGVMVGHDPAYVREADVVIYSSSISPDHPERIAALKAGKRVLHRAEALAEICEGKTTIAVSGTHGKTTTTGLIGTVLQEAGRDPSVVIGGLVISFGGNALVGGGPEIVIEADESDSSFLKFSPQLAVITNIEEEHMENFGTIQRVEEAYRNFILRLPKDGYWVGCGEDPRVVALAEARLRPSVLYGFKKNAGFLSASDLTECPEGKSGVSFRVWDGLESLGEVRMKILGKHNVLNALAAIAVGRKIGIPFETLAAALGTYRGAARRFDVKYEDAEVLVADDYAHHPTEIRKTLAALKGLKRKRIFAVFQPHRYTRAERFFSEFAGSFGDADKLVVTDVYAAGESPIAGINGRSFCAAIRAAGHPDVTYVERAAIAEWCLSKLKPGDLWVALGAGDVYHTSGQMAESLRKEIFKDLRGKVTFGEPLSRHTSLKVGGPAEYWIEPEDLEDLLLAVKICRKKKFPMRVFGAGSNILPPDEGLKGAVIHLNSGYFRQLKADGEGRIIARAGAQNSQFIQTALDAGLGGCEFLMGIPGNVGGSLAMNAGSHGESLDALLESVALVDLEGNLKTLKRSEVPFGYRSSGLKDVIIVEASFLLASGVRALTQEKLDSYRDYRLKTQDLQHPSAGCMFKNPKDSACSSGRLIEDAGLKGRRIGGAQVSLKHANFIINLGGATSRDIERLIREVKNTVKEKFSVELETEVRIL